MAVFNDPCVHHSDQCAGNTSEIRSMGGPSATQTSVKASRDRQSAEVFLLLPHLSGHGIAELLLDLLLGLGIEVGHVKHPANFDHFVVLSGDARGPFERLFA